MTLVRGPEWFAVPRNHERQYVYEYYGCRCYPCTMAHRADSRDRNARARAKRKAQKEAATSPTR